MAGVHCLCSLAQVLARKQLVLMQRALLEQQAAELVEQWSALEHEEERLRAAREAR
jgi:hypothetical protein